MRVGVVGGGVSGLSAVWALNEHSNHEVHLYEANEYVGGHTNTVMFHKPGEPEKKTMVDTGFIVFNEVTYPNFLAFIRHLGLPIIASDMSFAVTRTAPATQPRTRAAFAPSLGRNTASKPQRGEFEWAGSSPASLFCQWSNLFSPTHWRMVWDIIRFNHQSVEWLKQFDHASTTSSPASKQSIGDWLEQRGYSDSFSRNYLVPMTACIWSTPTDRTVSQFPALTLLRFMHNHHLLQILDRPQWLTLNGGWKAYVDRVLSKLPSERLHRGAQQGRVEKAWYDARSSQWSLRTADGTVQTFDRVIFAAHADTTVEMLSEEWRTDDKKSAALHDCLSSFAFNKNTVLLHTDEALMPVRRSAWSAWNFLAEGSSADGRADAQGVTLTYWMNLLQSLDMKHYGPILVTLNAPDNVVAPEKTLASYKYEHPIYTARSVQAQDELRSTWHGTWRGTYFVGAWTKYGFHEDGFSSGLRAAHALGATPPFEIRHAERATDTTTVSRYTGSAIERLNAVRATDLAALSVLLVAPFVVVLTLLLESIVRLVGGKGSSVPGELGRIRAVWEPSTHASVLRVLGGSGGANNSRMKARSNGRLGKKE